MGGPFLEAVADRWREEYDFVLIDSRTGVSDTSGICTVQMPNILVVLFTMNNQSIEGGAAVAASALKQRRKAGDETFSVLPLASRVELAELDKLISRRELVRDRFEQLLDGNLRTDALLRQWRELELPAVPYYGYEEVIAAFTGESEGSISLRGAYLDVTRYIDPESYEKLVGPMGSVSTPSMNETERKKVLSAFATFTNSRAETDPGTYDVFIIAESGLKDKALRLGQELSEHNLRVYIRRDDLSKGQLDYDLFDVSTRARWLVLMLTSSSSLVTQGAPGALPPDVLKGRVLSILWDGEWPENAPENLKQSAFLVRRKNDSAIHVSNRLIELIDPYGGARTRADAEHQQERENLKAELGVANMKMGRRGFLALLSFGIASIGGGVSLYREWESKKYPNKKFPRYVMNPRNREAIIPGLGPGFFRNLKRNDNSNSPKISILHYATLSGVPIPRGKTKLDRVRIRGGEKVSRKMSPVPEREWLQMKVTKGNHANLSVSSFPTELEAMAALRKDDPLIACDILIWGLKHELMLLNSSFKNPNYRLLDFLAGLASRYRLSKYLRAAHIIQKTMRKTPGLTEFQVARLDQMMLKWKRDSSWRRRWLARDKPLRWGGALLPALDRPSDNAKVNVS